LRSRFAATSIGRKFKAEVRHSSFLTFLIFL
jgi:hypothetical protein